MCPRENLVLIGFMGSGKSSIGRHVAKRLGFQFIDTDHIISDRAGMPIPRIFAERGEATFRELETRVLESLGYLNRCVVATGGGAVIREENRAMLRELGFVIGLTASEETIFERVSRNTKRPLLQTADPLGRMRELLSARREIYAQAAQFTLDTTGLTQEQATDAVIAEARRAFLWERAE